MAKEVTIHYIGKEWNSNFIVAKTKCGIDWEIIDEFTSEKQYVTCKKCLKKLGL